MMTLFWIIITLSLVVLLIRGMKGQKKKTKKIKKEKSLDKFFEERPFGDEDKITPKSCLSFIFITLIYCLAIFGIIAIVSFFINPCLLGLGSYCP